MTQTGLTAQHELDATAMAQIRELDAECARQDGFHVKLNWSMMERRSAGRPSDFFWYDNGRLVGYVPLDDFGGEGEITGLVLPSHRRRGIFRALYTAACEEARNRQARQLLLVGYGRSETSRAVVEALRLPYKFSEYRMEAEAAQLPTLPKSNLELVQATEADVEELARLLALAFGSGGWNAPGAVRDYLFREGDHFFLAKVGTETIGQIGAISDGRSAYIRAVGIVPEWRSRGYGRQMLAALVERLRAEGNTHFELDVETANRNALSLYESCGFHETIVYHYYTVF